MMKYRPSAAIDLIPMHWSTKSAEESSNWGKLSRPGMCAGLHTSKTRNESRKMPMCVNPHTFM
ncbi:hypothetical protein GGP47_003030 [Salinibacter ruber]|nr:hypothetical protein [Salinibacter ruber]